MNERWLATGTGEEGEILVFITAVFVFTLSSDDLLQKRGPNAGCGVQMGELLGKGRTDRRFSVVKEGWREEKGSEDERGGSYEVRTQFAKYVLRPEYVVALRAP